MLPLLLVVAPVLATVFPPRDVAPAARFGDPALFESLTAGVPAIDPPVPLSPAVPPAGKLLPAEEPPPIADASPRSEYPPEAKLPPEATLPPEPRPAVPAPPNTTAENLRMIGNGERQVT